MNFGQQMLRLPDLLTNISYKLLQQLSDADDRAIHTFPCRYSKHHPKNGFCWRLSTCVTYGLLSIVDKFKRQGMKNG